MMRRAKALGAAVLLGSAAGLAAYGDPSVEERVARLAPELDRRLGAREVHIDPAELLDLMHDNQIRTAVMDVRDEASFNLFHLVDARRADPEALPDAAVRSLPERTVVVVVSNGDRRAEAAWKRLAAAGVRNAYILSGGMNGWLDLYGGAAPEGATVAARDPGDETFRHAGRFTAALGARHAAARPDPKRVPARPYTRKVTIDRPKAGPGGGCGG